MTDVVQRVDDLLTDARAERAAVAATRLHPRPSVEGADATGSVVVLWRDDELSLEFAAGWESRLSADDLTGAAAQALTAALRERYSDEGLRTSQDETEAPVETPAPDPYVLINDPAFHDVIRRPEFPARLDALLAEVERRAARRLSGSAPSGAVTVRLGHDGEVAGFLVDPERARGRSGASLTDDARRAVEDARRRFASDDPDAAPMTPREMIEVLNA